MNNSDILGEEAAVRQIVEDDFSATNGHFEDDSVTTLRKNVLRGKTTLKSVSLPNVTKLPNQVVYECSTLENITAPKATIIAGNAIRSCRALKKIILPSVVYIEDCGVSYNDSLEMIDILGQNSPSLMNGALRNNGVLKALILRNTDGVVKNSGSNVFVNTPFATNGAGGAYVYVPRNLISSYQTATNWSTLYAAHSDMFRALEDYTVDGTTTGDFDETKL